ncbi:MAG: nucleotidyl transferase AbiEii/AbiGii toxin family protein [bacterium]|nr:nucleotidyl transferase AbiEii/AbiGii toxin family protein [bacterium]
MHQRKCWADGTGSHRPAIPTRLSWQLDDDPDDPDGQTLLFTYPTAFPAKAVYLRQTVKIEMGARSDTEPSETIIISPYISDVYPKLLPESKIEVRAVKPTRTFWEKAMLLHEETYRPVSGKRRKEYMARHYYDLYKLIEKGIAQDAMADESLFSRVASHRAVFFRQNWVDYTTLVKGKLRLVPTENQIPDWRSDYNNMKQEMFFGETPDFDLILQIVQKFQDDFNQGSA